MNQDRIDSCVEMLESEDPGDVSLIQSILSQMALAERQQVAFKLISNISNDWALVPKRGMDGVIFLRNHKNGTEFLIGALRKK